MNIASGGTNKDIEDKESMFDGCKNLEQDFSNWNVENVLDRFMFDGCTKMEESYKKVITYTLKDTNNAKMLIRENMV